MCLSRRETKDVEREKHETTSMLTNLGFCLTLEGMDHFPMYLFFHFSRLIMMQLVISIKLAEEIKLVCI